MKNLFFKLGLAAAAAFFLIGCVSEKKHKVNIVVAHYRADPPSLHPVNANDITQNFIFQYTQKSVTRIDLRTLQPIPELAKSLPSVSADKLSYTYELREDVRWDDGSPLTVDDIIFTVKANKSPLSDNAVRRSAYDNIFDIEKVPGSLLKFVLKAKSVYFANISLLDETYILQKAHWDPKGIMDKVSIPELDAKDFDPKKTPGLTEWAQTFNAGPKGHDPKELIGLGAYQISEWNPGSSITLTRKEHWWGEKDTSIYNSRYPDKIIFRLVSDEEALTLALKNQSVDVTSFLNSASYVKLKGDTAFTNRYSLGTANSNTVSLMALNLHEPLFEDRRVRWAIAELTPVDEILKLVTLGTGIRMVSFVSPAATLYFNDELKPIPVDIEQAKRLLDEAGWKDTDGDLIRDKVINGKKTKLSFSVLYVTDPVLKEALLLARETMLKAGVDMNPQSYDPAVMVERAQKHDFDAVVYSLSGAPVPDDPGQVFLSENWANGGYNFSGFGNAHTDSLIRKSNEAVEPAERAMLLKQLEKIVYDEQPMIFLYGTKRKFAVNRRFDNIALYNMRPGIILSNLKLRE